MSEIKDSYVRRNSQQLCFDHNVFLKESFFIDDFLRNQRNKATLEILRNDLGIYLKDLRLSMIELINKDYEDFVNLSKDLVDLNVGIDVLQNPLDSVKAEVNLVRSSLHNAITGMKLCIQQIYDVRKKKQSLFHLSQVIISITKLKKLLDDDDTNSNKLIATDNLEFVERITSEYTVLRFSASKCREMMSSSQLREYNSIESTLMDLLKNSFLSGICERDTRHLKRCLRIFASVDKIKEAEALVEKEIVAPFLYDVINESSLKKDPDGLTGIYRKVEAFLDGQMSVLLELKNHHFNFVTNSLWTELAKRLELHTSSIFSAGDPEVFHARYMATRSFLDNLRSRCSDESAHHFDAHPQTIHFIQKWNLQVYFKIRFQEIAGQLEWTLTKVWERAWNGSEYHLRTPAITIMCLQRCWDYNIFIPELLPSFWKLSLQIIARYCTWIKNETSKDKIDTVAPIDTSWPSAYLQNLVWLYTDTSRIISEANNILNTAKLSNHNQSMDSSLAESCDLLSLGLSTISYKIENQLVEKSVESLSHVRDIPRLFRRTNRETPTKPCEYVNHILSPVFSFHATYKSAVLENVLNQWLINILTKVSSLYHSSVSEVLENAQKTEESLRRLKKANTKYSSSIENKGLSDDDKIREQLVVDVRHYCESCEQVLKIGIGHIPHLQELMNLVEKARGRYDK